jgi:hypothetical protein
MTSGDQYRVKAATFHTQGAMRNVYAVQVYQYADNVWIADGEFRGHQLRTRGSTAKKAVTAWENAAVDKGLH